MDRDGGIGQLETVHEGSDYQISLMLIMIARLLKCFNDLVDMHQRLSVTCSERKF